MLLKKESLCNKNCFENIFINSQCESVDFQKQSTKEKLITKISITGRRYYFEDLRFFIATFTPYYA